MSDCCSNHASKIVGEICPKCKTACKSVEHKTLYHQVKFPENQMVFQDKYYFCPTKKCPVGYFSSAGHFIAKKQLRSYQEIEGDKICYCFDINTKQYLGKQTGWYSKLFNLFQVPFLALKANNADAIKNFVIQKTKSGDCACEIKNPSAQCCLAKFKHLEQEFATITKQHIAVPEKFSYLTPWLFILTLIWLTIYASVFPDPIGLAGHYWFLIVVGVLGAVIGNATAIGGGIVFIPVLMFAYQVDPVTALKLSFVTQAVGMTSGASGWLRRGEVPLTLLTWTVPSLVIGTMLSTFLIHPQPMLVKGLFGPIAFIAGLLTLITLDRKDGRMELPAQARIPIVFVSFVGGMITGWVAIGEGEIIAAFCMLVYGLNANRAIGLGVVLLSVNSLLLAAIHVFYYGGIPWDMVAFTILGVLWGGRLGAFLTQWFSIHTTKKVFAFIALLDGLVVTLQASYVMFFLK